MQCYRCNNNVFPQYWREAHDLGDKYSLYYVTRVYCECYGTLAYWKHQIVVNKAGRAVSWYSTNNINTADEYMKKYYYVGKHEQDFNFIMLQV